MLIGVAARSGAVTPDSPEVRAVVERACCAATDDPRFPPVEPDELAEQVRDAVLAKRFYVFTRDGSLDEARARFERIVTGDNPESPGLG